MSLIRYRHGLLMRVYVTNVGGIHGVTLHVVAP